MLHLAVIGIVCAVSAPIEDAAFYNGKNNSSNLFSDFDRGQQIVVSLPNVYDVVVHNSSECDGKKITNRTSSFFYKYIIKQYQDSKNSSCSVMESVSSGKKKRFPSKIGFPSRKKRFSLSCAKKKLTKTLRPPLDSTPEEPKICRCKKPKHSKEVEKRRKKKCKSDLNCCEKQMLFRLINARTGKQNSCKPHKRHLDRLKVDDELDLNKRIEKLVKEIAVENQRKENSEKEMMLLSEGIQDSDVNSGLFEGKPPTKPESFPFFNHIKNIYHFSKNYFNNKIAGVHSVPVNSARGKDLVSNKAAHISSYDLLKTMKKTTRYRRNLRANNLPYRYNGKTVYKNELIDKTNPHSVHFKGKRHFLRRRTSRKFIPGQRRRRRRNMKRRKRRRRGRKVKNWPLFKMNRYRTTGLRMRRDDPLKSEISKDTKNQINELIATTPGVSYALQDESQFKQPKKKETNFGTVPVKENDSNENTTASLLTTSEDSVEDNVTKFNVTDEVVEDYLPDHTLEKPFLERNFRSRNSGSTPDSDYNPNTEVPLNSHSTSKYKVELPNEENLTPNRYLQIRHCLRNYLVHNKVLAPVKRKIKHERNVRYRKSCGGSRKCWRSPPLLCIPYIKRGQEDQLRYLIKVLQNMIGKPFPPKVDIFDRTKYKPCMRKPDNSCDDSEEDDSYPDYTTEDDTTSNECSTCQPMITCPTAPPPICPTTCAPPTTTCPPITCPPITCPPITFPPITFPPPTCPPTTCPPTTCPPTTCPPTTCSPRTCPPRTYPPKTCPPPNCGSDCSSSDAARPVSLPPICENLSFTSSVSECTEAKIPDLPFSFPVIGHGADVTTSCCNFDDFVTTQQPFPQGFIYSTTFFCNTPTVPAAPPYSASIPPVLRAPPSTTVCVTSSPAPPTPSSTSMQQPIQQKNLASSPKLHTAVGSEIPDEQKEYFSFAAYSFNPGPEPATDSFQLSEVENSNCRTQLPPFPLCNSNQNYYPQRTVCEGCYTTAHSRPRTNPQPSLHIPPTMHPMLGTAAPRQEYQVPRQFKGSQKPAYVNCVNGSPHVKHNPRNRRPYYLKIRPQVLQRMASSEYEDQFAPPTEHNSQMRYEITQNRLFRMHHKGIPRQMHRGFKSLDYNVNEKYPTLEQGLRELKFNRYHGLRNNYIQEKRSKEVEKRDKPTRRKRGDDYYSWPEGFSDYSDYLDDPIYSDEDSRKHPCDIPKIPDSWTPPSNDMFNELAKAVTSVVNTINISTTVSDGKNVQMKNLDQSYKSSLTQSFAACCSVNGTRAFDHTQSIHTTQNSQRKTNDSNTRIIASSTKTNKIAETTRPICTSFPTSLKETKATEIEKVTNGYTTGDTLGSTITMNQKGNKQSSTSQDSNWGTTAEYSRGRGDDAKIMNTTSSPSSLKETKTTEIEKVTNGYTTGDTLGSTITMNQKGDKQSSTSQDSNWGTTAEYSRGRGDDAKIMNTTSSPSSLKKTTETEKVTNVDTLGSTITMNQKGDKHSSTSQDSNWGTTSEYSRGRGDDAKIMNTTSSPSSLNETKTTETEKVTNVDTLGSTITMNQKGDKHSSTSQDSNWGTTAEYSRGRGDDAKIMNTTSPPSRLKETKTTETEKVTNVDTLSSTVTTNQKGDKQSTTCRNSNSGDDGQMPTTLKMTGIAKGPKKLVTKPYPKVYTKVYPESLGNEPQVNETTATAAVTTVTTCRATAAVAAAPVVTSTSTDDLKLQILAVCEGYLEIIKLIKAQNQTPSNSLDLDLAGYCENIISQSFNPVLTERCKKPETTETTPQSHTLYGSPKLDENPFTLNPENEIFENVSPEGAADSAFKEDLKGIIKKKNSKRKKKRRHFKSLETNSSEAEKSDQTGKPESGRKKKRRKGHSSGKLQGGQRDIKEGGEVAEELLTKGVTQEQIELIQLLRKRKKALMAWLLNPTNQEKTDDLQETEYFDDNDLRESGSDQDSGTGKPKRGEKSSGTTEKNLSFVNESIFPVYAKQYGYDSGGEVREVEVLWRKVNEKTHEKKIFKNMSVLALLLTSTNSPDLQREGTKSVGWNGDENEEIQSKCENNVGFAADASAKCKESTTVTATPASTQRSSKNETTCIVIAKPDQKNTTRTIITRPDVSSIVGKPPKTNKTHTNITHKLTHKFGAAKDLFQEYSIEFLDYAVYILPIMFTILFLFCCLCCAVHIFHARKRHRRRRKKKKVQISTDDSTEKTEECEFESKKRKREVKRKRKSNDESDGNLSGRRSKFWNVLKLHPSRGSSEKNENTQTEKKKSFLRFLKGRKDEEKTCCPLSEVEEQPKSSHNSTDGNQTSHDSDEEPPSRMRRKEEEKHKCDEENEAAERRELIALLEELKKIEMEHTEEKKEVKSVQVQYMSQEDENVFRRPEFYEKNVFGLPKGYSFYSKQIPFHETQPSAVRDYEFCDGVNELTELLPYECGYYAKKNDYCDFRINEEGRCKRFLNVFRDSGVSRSKPFLYKNCRKNESENRKFIFNKYRSINTDESKGLMGVTYKNAGTEVKFVENESPFTFRPQNDSSLVEEMENFKRQLNIKKYAHLKDDGVLCRL